RKCAVTFSFAVSLENDSAGKAARCGVRRRRADVEHVAAVLFQICLKVVAQTIVESESATYFPVILNKKCPRMIPRPHPGRNAVIAAIGRADQKTRIVESDAGWKRYALERGKSRLVRTVEHIARRVCFAERRKSVHDQLRAGFICVIVAYPGQRDIPRRFQVFD